MDSHCRWTLFCLFLLLSPNNVVVFAQNAVQNGPLPQLYIRESPPECNGIPGVAPQQMNNHLPIYPTGIQDLTQIPFANECQRPPVCQETILPVQDVVRPCPTQPLPSQNAGPYIPRSSLPPPTLFGPPFLSLPPIQNVPQQCPVPILPNALPPSQCPPNLPLVPIQQGPVIIPGNEILPMQCPPTLVPPPGLLPIQNQNFIPIEALSPINPLPPVPCPMPGGPLMNKLSALPPMGPFYSLPMQQDPFLPLLPIDTCPLPPYPMVYPLINEPQFLPQGPINNFNLYPIQNGPNCFIQDTPYLTPSQNILPPNLCPQIPGPLNIPPPCIGPVPNIPLGNVVNPIPGPCLPPTPANLPINIPQNIGPIYENIQLFPLAPVNQPIIPLNTPPSCPIENLPPFIQNCGPVNVPGPFYPLPNVNEFSALASPTYPIGLPPVLQVPNTCDTLSVKTEECSVPVPINLHITMPPPTVPSPKITIINTPPASVEPTTIEEAPNGDIDIIPPYPLPPIIIEGRRSRSRSWLPLFIVALFAGDGFYGGGNSGCYCNSNSGGSIPVPYPIPIPTSNPIILGEKPR